LGTYSGDSTPAGSTALSSVFNDAANHLVTRAVERQEISGQSFGDRPPCRIAGPAAPGLLNVVTDRVEATGATPSGNVRNDAERDPELGVRGLPHQALVGTGVYRRGTEIRVTPGVGRRGEMLAQPDYAGRPPGRFAYVFPFLLHGDSHA
jgi:hypothetical protein